MRRIAARRNHEDGECVIERHARLKIAMVLARTEHHRVSGLVTGHANIVGEPWFKLGGIHNGMRWAIRARVRIAFLHFVDVSCTRTVAILAADREFMERRFEKPAVSAEQRSWLSAVTRDAARKNRAVEAVIAKFIAG